jgi:transcriptional regulator with XRE-family HTH domain
MKEPSENSRSGRVELAKFLRSRREHLAPEEAGVTRSGSRRTPGLRREEVASLAGIGVKWYARLEMADDVRPSTKTLLAIARALQLNQTEVDYLFELSGLSAPREYSLAVGDLDVPELLATLVVSIHGVSAVVCDRFLTPLRWNSIADAMLRCSAYATPLERNVIVRGFNDSFFRDYCGDDFERAARNAVGMFRRYLAAREPDDFSQQIYERIKDAPLFQKFWGERSVADELNAEEPIVRFHPVVGRYTCVPLDAYLAHHDNLVLKLYFPADDEAKEKFIRLEALGTAWTPNRGRTGLTPAGGAGQPISAEEESS